jgi:hypothetical protein
MDQKNSSPLPQVNESEYRFSKVNSHFGPFGSWNFVMSQIFGTRFGGLKFIHIKPSLIDHGNFFEK